MLLSARALKVDGRCRRRWQQPRRLQMPHCFGEQALQMMLQGISSEKRTPILPVRRRSEKPVGVFVATDLRRDPAVALAPCLLVSEEHLEHSNRYNANAPVHDHSAGC